jgi:hypothetical protein
MILEFVEKWKSKKASANKLQKEFNKYNEQESKKISELFNLLENIEKEYMERKRNQHFDEFEVLRNQNVLLSSRFQNIHIAQLLKLAEEDKQKKTNNEDNTFDFWLFFQSKIEKNLLFLNR